MKITYLELKNFANIFSSMKRRQLKIDLSKSKNRIVLLVGANGSGKTSILSELHPFATPGNMDIRNTTTLIMEGEDGYKEIHFQKDNDEYVVKHFYYNKAGKGVKSFISKNGNELNANGNVTSFKEMVHIELFLEPDYLKLLRLGSNVANFIDMKATERKNFTSDLLQDIDVYTKYFKKINDDSRLLKSLMKSVTDKIDKLKVFDEKEEKRHLKELEKQLTDLKESFNKVGNEIGKNEGAISVLIPEGIDSFNNLKSEKKRTVRELNLDVQNKETQIERLGIDGSVNIDKELKKKQQRLNQLNSTISSNKNMIEFYFKQLEAYYQQREDKQNNLKYITSDVELSSLTSLYLELNRKYEDFKEKFENFKPKCTRDELLQSMSLLQEIDNFINDIHAYDRKAVKEVVRLVRDGENVEHFVRHSVAVIDKKVSSNKIRIQQMNASSGVINNSDKVYVMFKPPTCDCECPFQQFYEDVTAPEEKSPKKTLIDENESLETRRDYLMSFLDISKTIDYIFLVIKSNKVLIEKLPYDNFNISLILDSIEKYEPFYNEDELTNYVALLEEFEEFKDLKVKIKEVRREKEFIEKNSATITNMQEELNKLDQEIFKVERDLDKLKGDNTQLVYEIDDLEDELSRYELFIERNKEVQQLRVERNQLVDELEKMTETHEKVKDYVEERKELETRRRMIGREVENTEKVINQTQYRLKEFQSLTEERKLLDDKFEEISIIKESLSSNKGIPLLFIQLYLKNTKIMVNQLINPVYDGTLEINDFIINEKEFKIPYTKNGMRVDDAAYCSQGEKSFISLALSFAFIEQSIKDYNIMLLDEIDATLDTSNRQKFIQILETQLDSIHAEQAFMITHNNMFDNYPVDIIMLSEMDIENYKNTNIIYKAS